MSPFPDILGGDAGELFNFRGHKAAGGQGDEFVIFLHHGGDAIYLLHYNGGEFDDLVPVEQQSGGLRVKQHQPVIFGK